MNDTNHDRITGALLGVALGDALGLPYEGLSARYVSRRALDRFRLLGATGFVSDDTEQTALVAQALLKSGGDCRAFRRAFRRSMIGWFARLPFGIGGATLRSCVRMAFGLPRPGVFSAGNGAAMRAGILGAHFAFDGERRAEFGKAIAELTHTDPRAVESALFVAEVAAASTRGGPLSDRVELVRECRSVLLHPQLGSAVDNAIECAERKAKPDVVAAEFGNSGFVVHSIAVCTYSFLLAGDDPMRAIRTAIRVGGDTDTHAAIVGGWVGALHGASSLPTHLIDKIHDGPFGGSHLRALGSAMSSSGPPPHWFWVTALIRNLALYPVILAHGFTRLWRR